MLLHKKSYSLKMASAYLCTKLRGSHLAGAHLLVWKRQGTIVPAPAQFAKCTRSLTWGLKTLGLHFQLSRHRNMCYCCTEMAWHRCCALGVGNSYAAEIKEKKWPSVGHVMQGQDNRWSLTGMKWMSREAKCSRKRQKVRWADEINKYVGIEWPQLAKYRVV